MKVNEFINKLDYAMGFLQNDEMFGDMFLQGYFDDHSECYEDSNYGGCILCIMNLPTRKVTINDLVELEKDFKEYENHFHIAYENYLAQW